MPLNKRLVVAGVAAPVELCRDTVLDANARRLARCEAAFRSVAFLHTRWNPKRIPDACLMLVSLPLWQGV